MLSPFMHNNNYIMKDSPIKNDPSGRIFNKELSQTDVATGSFYMVKALRLHPLTHRLILEASLFNKS